MVLNHGKLTGIILQQKARQTRIRQNVFVLRYGAINISESIITRCRFMNSLSLRRTPFTQNCYLE